MIISLIAIATFDTIHYHSKREIYVSSLNKQKPHLQKEDEVNANIFGELTL